jgi:hypothetical protein
LEATNALGACDVEREAVLEGGQLLGWPEPQLAPEAASGLAASCAADQ